MAKKMIIKGVGTFMAKRLAKNGGIEVITLGTLQNLRINFNTEIEDIFGGDGLFPIDNLVRSKTIEITATDAKFDLAALQLMMGSSIREGVTETLWVLGEGQTVAEKIGTVTVGFVDLDFASNLAPDPSFSVRLKDTNKLLTQVPYAADTAPEADEFMFDATSKQLIFNPSLKGMDVVINYKRQDTNVDVADILVDEVPFPVSVVHHGSFLQKDGTYAGIETELYACRARGTFAIDTQRAAASASEVSLVVIDPERADGKLGSVKLYTATSHV